MESWKSFVNDRVKGLVNLDYVGKIYIDKIKEKLKSNPVNFAKRLASSEMVVILAKSGVSNHDAVSMLHFCLMEFMPELYNGCGCHEHLKRSDYATNY